jgi:hypothetical protein
VSEPRRASKIGWHRQERLRVSFDEYVLDASTEMIIRLEQTNGGLQAHLSDEIRSRPQEDHEEEQAYADSVVSPGELVEQMRFPYCWRLWR